jgi:RNA polymerase sigma-70 factor (ECF subfamily)
LDETNESEETRFERLWREHYASVFAFARARVPSDELADDVAAETFAVAWRHRQREPRNPRIWLFAVARKTLSNQRRGQRRQQGLIARISNERPDGSLPDSGGATDSLAEAFNKLSFADREALSLVVWEELRPREAAEVLGITPAGFSVRLHRAKARLRKELALAGHSLADAAERNTAVVERTE